MLSHFISAEHIDSAYQQLCYNRRNHPSNSDIWDFRFHWANNKTSIIRRIKSHCYTLQPLRVITKKDNSQVVIAY